MGGWLRIGVMADFGVSGVEPWVFLPNFSSLVMGGLKGGDH
jgi:hypothetical protein